jgi:hypothetical protein
MKSTRTASAFSTPQNTLRSRSGDSHSESAWMAVRPHFSMVGLRILMFRSLGVVVGGAAVAVDLAASSNLRRFGRSGRTRWTCITSALNLNRQ